MRTIFSVMALGLTVASTPAIAQEMMTLQNLDGSCYSYHKGPSPESDEIKKVTFLNSREARVWPAWITHKGYFAVYPEEIPPGGKFTTYSRVGHQWIIIDGANWHCVQNITIAGDMARYEIN